MKKILLIFFSLFILYKYYDTNKKDWQYSNLIKRQIMFNGGFLLNFLFLNQS